MTHISVFNRLIQNLYNQTSRVFNRLHSECLIVQLAHPKSQCPNHRPPKLHQTYKYNLNYRENPQSSSSRNSKWDKWWYIEAQAKRLEKLRRSMLLNVCGERKRYTWISNKENTWTEIPLALIQLPKVAQYFVLPQAWRLDNGYKIWNFNQHGRP